jgi:hypothetical protein
MNKKIIIKPKPFSSASSNNREIPQNIEENLDKWIRGANFSESEKKSEPEKIVRVNFTLNIDKHMKLKMICVKKQTSIKEFLLKLIEQQISENEL